MVSNCLSDKVILYLGMIDRDEGRGGIIYDSSTNPRNILYIPTFRKRAKYDGIQNCHGGFVPILKKKTEKDLQNFVKNLTSYHLRESF